MITIDLFSRSCGALPRLRRFRRVPLGLSLFSLLLTLGVTPIQARTILIDFGGSGSQAIQDALGRRWNNLTNDNGGRSDTGQLFDMLSADGDPTGVGLSMIRRFNDVNANGTTDGTSGSSQYPPSVTRDSLYGNTESFNGAGNIFPSFKLTGLDPEGAYKFTFYASRMGVNDNRETGYTVTGMNTGFAALNAANNVENLATVEGITPTSAGEITISLAPTANNNNANHFTYLGALQVDEDEVLPTDPVSILREPEDQSVLQMRPATFSVQIQGSPPFSIQWHQNGVPIPDATQTTYTIPAATLDLDGTVYTVVAGNSLGNITSREALLTVIPDTQAPSLISSRFRDSNTVLLSFSEALDPDQATEIASYLVSDAEGPLTIWEVYLSEDGREVEIELEEPVTRTLTVEFEGLRDMVGNLLPSETKAVLSVADPNTFLFDFGGTGETTLTSWPPHDPVNAWNNITSFTVGEAGWNLVTADGEATEAGLVIISRFGGVNGNGTRDERAPFPVMATRDSFYGNTEEFLGLSNMKPVFALTGLDRSKEYDLTFYASRIGTGGDKRGTRYTATGANSNFADLDASENIFHTVTVSGIVPTQGESGGEIVISLTPTESNNNANHFVYLGVMKVSFRDRDLTPADPVMLPPVLRNGRLTLNWTGTGVLEWSETMRENEWQPVTPAPLPPYTEDVVPGAKRFFRVIRR